MASAKGHGSPRQRASSGASEMVVEELGDWIEEVPTVRVREMNLAELQRTGSIASLEESVYEVALDFGSLGAWKVHATRSALSGLISSLQLNRLLGLGGTADHDAHGGVGLKGGPGEVEAMEVGDGAARHRAGSTQSVANTFARRNGRLVRQKSTRRLGPEYQNAEEEEEDPGALQARKIVLGMSKLLFNPAVGTQSRVRKVKEKRVQLIQSIFEQILGDVHARNSNPVKEFLCISTLTFDFRLGKSYKEGWVKVSTRMRSGEDEKLEWGKKVGCCCCVCACATDPGRCASFFEPHYRKNRKMWAVVKGSFVAFFDEQPHELDPRKPSVVVVFSNSLEVLKGFGTTRSNKEVVLVEDSKIVRLKFHHKWAKKVWASAILDAVSNAKKTARPEQRGGWVCTHDFGSFAPRRFHSTVPESELCRGKFLVDGQAAFAAIYDALSSAESQIFISGWWVCSNLQLLRPAQVDDDTSLVSLLKRKAREGVQVNVLMYNEVAAALPLGSTHQLRELEKAEEDLTRATINVLRHPAHEFKANSTWFWSHHEKVVVVDQCHAFAGGIDVAWGRFDMHEHPLYDAHHGEKRRMFPGIDFSNVRVKDFVQVSDYGRQQHPEDCPRMPWHDVHCEWRGSIARDLARHFIQQWNYARLSLYAERKVRSLLPMDRLPFEFLTPAGSEAKSDSDDAPAKLEDQAPPSEGKDENGNTAQSNGNHDASASAKLEDQAPPSEGDDKKAQSDSNGAPQDSEADDASGGQGQNSGEMDESQSSGADDASTDKIDRSGAPSQAHAAAADDDDGNTSDATITDSDVDEEAAEEETDLRKEKGDEGHPDSQAQSDEDKETPDNDVPQEKGRTASILAQEVNAKWGFAVDAQVVRSRGPWSGAAPGDTEASLARAMCSLIESAEKFVYIENQYFVSGLETDSKVANRVLESLFKRIKRAHEAKSTFKVVVVLPLLPALEGAVADTPALRRILHFQYRGICRGRDSLFHNLLQAGVDPDNYICFFSLRTWGVTTSPQCSKKLATELVYVHSKVLIVDDAACMIGSGNINDRSLLGHRDSEVSVVVRDCERGGAEEAGFCRQFRLALSSEHWGDSEDMAAALGAPWEAEHFQTLRATAVKNTGIFEKHFDFVPRNDVRTLDELHMMSSSAYATLPYTDKVAEELADVKGHIVLFPLNFLVQWDGLKPGRIDDASGALVGDEVFI